MPIAPDDTTYYAPRMVLNITEFDTRGIQDMDMFLVYDEDEDLIYVYGSRGYEPNGDVQYEKYVKSFATYADLYNFISLTMGFQDRHRVNVSVNLMSGLTNYCEYDAYKNNVCRENEIVAYDNIHLPKHMLLKYISAFLC